MNETPKFKVGGSGIRNRKTLRKVITKFSEKVGKSVKISFPSDEWHPRPYTGESFDLGIYLGCSPLKMYSISKVNLYDSMFFGNCDVVRSNFPYKFKKIIDPGGVEVAMIRDKTLFVFCHFYDVDKDSAEIKILEGILDDYALYLQHRNLFVKEMRQRQSSQRIEDRLRFLISEGLKEKRDTEIRQTKYNVISASKDLCILARRRSIRGLKELGTEGPYDIDKLKTLYTKLCDFSVTGVVHVKQGGGKVEIPIGQIDIEHNGVVYDIGKFLLIIDLDRKIVRCQNISRAVVGNYNHPSMGRDAEEFLYMGEASYGAAVLLGEMKLDILVPMIIEALKTYDPNDHQCDIENWPVKNRETTPAEETK